LHINGLKIVVQSLQGGDDAVKDEHFNLQGNLLALLIIFKLLLRIKHGVASFMLFYCASDRLCDQIAIGKQLRAYGLFVAIKGFA
jgi:hypothetical protein